MGLRRSLVCRSSVANSVILTKALAAAAATNVCLSQTPGAAGALTINGAAATGGVATLDTQRRLRITCGGNNSARTFTVTGTTESGYQVSETMAGTNGSTTDSVQDYLTVTSIVIDGASTGTVTVGTMTTGSTPWKNMNTWANPFAAELDCSITGTITYSIETTNSRYLSSLATVNVQATAVVGTSAVAKLAITSPVRAWRATITAGTGSVTVEAIQAG